MILLIDNYDSFTYNLYQYLCELGAEVTVIRNDKISVDEVANGDWEGIVISPGPCDPDQSGVSLECIPHVAGKIPLLGVCLGHQCIAQSYGGKVVRAPVPVHGKASFVFHEGSDVFADMPSPFEAGRYHSLIAEESSFPDVLEITARSKDDDLIMGLRHKTLPIFGVQFHPESILTKNGKALLQNFLNLCRAHNDG